MTNKYEKRKSKRVTALKPTFIYLKGNTFKVHDISNEGIGIVLSDDGPSFAVGERLPEIPIPLLNGTVNLRGCVSHVSYMATGKLCGIQFLFENAEYEVVMDFIRECMQNPTDEEGLMSATVKIEVCQITATASEATARQHKVLSDRPPAKGGEDKGPMGGELLLMGLGGCFMSNLLAAVKAREAEVKDLHIAIAGTLSEAPMRFSAIRMEISGEYADRAEMEKLVTIAERGCIVANTLKNAIDLSLVVV